MAAYRADARALVCNAAGDTDISRALVQQCASHSQRVAFLKAASLLESLAAGVVVVLAFPSHGAANSRASTEASRNLRGKSVTK